MDAPEISLFRGHHAFLSNFHKVRVPYDGYVYPTAEHAYQAAKVGGPEEVAGILREEIRRADSPVLAKRLGRHIAPLRKDWEARKVGVMAEIVTMKFALHADLRRALLATGESRLIHGNTHGDVFWGAVREGSAWLGENVLGRILEGIRERLA